MMQLNQSQEIKELALKRYQNNKCIFDRKDRWHFVTYTRTHHILQNWRNHLHKKQNILNIGSGGEDYLLFPERQFHVDIVPTLIKDKRFSIVADAESLPFLKGTFDAVICVGSVVNYCSLLEVIIELIRVTKRGGLIILDFETSDSWEYLFTKNWRKNISITSTFFQGTTEKIWTYSRNYVKNVIDNSGGKILDEKSIHGFSSFALLALRNSYIASYFEWLDQLFIENTFISKGACNCIIIFEKVSE